MKKRYEVIYSPKAKAFKDGLGEKEKKKINFVISKTELNFLGDWFKKIKGADGIWEFVVDYQGIFYRILAFFDTRARENPLIIATHGFKKKSNKTPKTEIEKSRSI